LIGSANCYSDQVGTRPPSAHPAIVDGDGPNSHQFTGVFQREWAKTMLLLDASEPPGTFDEEVAPTDCSSRFIESAAVRKTSVMSGSAEA